MSANKEQIMSTAKKVLAGENQIGYLGLLVPIISCLFIVSITSACLRLTEEFLIPNPNSKLLAIRTVQAAELSYAAEITSQNNQQINIKPKTTTDIIITFKNIGNATWTKKDVYLKSLTTAMKFNDPSWEDLYVPAHMQEEKVAPGAVATFKLKLLSTPTFGAQTADFVLVRSNVMIAGGEYKITLNVSENPTVALVPPANQANPSAPNVCTLNLRIAGINNLDNATCVEKFALNNSGPNIKIGIYYTNSAIALVNNQPWMLYDQNDTLLATVPANESMNFFYKKDTAEYIFDFNNQTIKTSLSLKLKNPNNGIFEIINYKDIPSWNKSINYNKFSGNLEIKYNQYKERVWMIEEVPLETYLTGMKETSNSDPIEYLKAMTIAARTYALYHLNKQFQQDPFFNLYNDERDQVYKGYASTPSMPNLTKAAEETKGIVATYADEVVLAFYSARSGGQTVGYKNIPYLKPVSAPYSKTLGKWGHAIGIDAHDAMNRAKKDGWTADQILKYYYNNIKIEKIY